VTNVTAFGAFVDIGVHQDGLVHISELSDRFVRNPLEVVKVHQKVLVTVLAVDPERNRSRFNENRPGAGTTFSEPAETRGTDRQSAGRRRGRSLRLSIIPSRNCSKRWGG
jgi:uncharacterized protein